MIYFPRKPTIYPTFTTVLGFTRCQAFTHPARPRRLFRFHQVSRDDAVGIGGTDQVETGAWTSAQQNAPKGKCQAVTDLSPRFLVAFAFEWFLTRWQQAGKSQRCIRWCVGHLSFSMLNRKALILDRCHMPKLPRCFVQESPYRIVLGRQCWCSDPSCMSVQKWRSFYFHTCSASSGSTFLNHHFSRAGRLAQKCVSPLTPKTCDTVEELWESCNMVPFRGSWSQDATSGQNRAKGLKQRCRGTSLPLICADPWDRSRQTAIVCASMQR